MTRTEIEKAALLIIDDLIDKRFAIGRIIVEPSKDVISERLIQIHDAALEEAALIPGMCMTGCYGTVLCAHCAQKAEYIRALKIGAKGER